MIRVPTWSYDPASHTVVCSSGVRLKTVLSLQTMDQAYETSTIGDPANWYPFLAPDCALSHLELQAAIIEMHGGARPSWCRAVNTKAAATAAKYIVEQIDLSAR